MGRHSLEDYQPLIGSEVAERIRAKAAKLDGLSVVHISSTFYGGGVAEILTPLTLLMNAMGIEAGWRMIQGTQDFFTCTKKIHNLLQGSTVDLSSEEMAIYEQVVFENATRLHLEDRDAIVVHDPQPLPLVRHFQKRQAPWIWRCHIDLSVPTASIWKYLSAFVEQYDAAIFSLSEYAQELRIPQHFIMPAISPFSAKNRELSEDEITATLAHHDIPTDRPLVVQVSRFDKWKDPLGVIEAFCQAREQVDSTLVLLGNNAVDDPEGDVTLETIHSSIDERVIVLAGRRPHSGECAPTASRCGFAKVDPRRLRAHGH